MCLLGVEAGELRGPNGKGSGAIRWRFYRQHQLHLETGTYRNTDFKPDWYPDPLIPFEHPLAAEKLKDVRLKAVPFDLPAGETHGFWVDLYVSSNALPGEYRGMCRVTADQGQAVEIPVILTVWDFALPQTPTLVTEFGSPRLRDYYRQRAKAGNEPEPSDWTAVEAQCAQFALLEHLGKAAEAEAIVKPLTESFFQWDKNPAAYGIARAKLAAMILAASSRGNATPSR